MKSDTESIWRNRRETSARQAAEVVGVLEVVSDHRGDTFRAVYAVRYQDRVYVLHAFQKKPKKGIATPQPDIAVPKQRLARAATLHATREN